MTDKGSKSVSEQMLAAFLREDADGCAAVYTELCPSVGLPPQV
jgi:hypothetical protein